METIQILLLTIVALMGIPAGFILRYFTMEEMKPGRKWFRMIAMVSLVIILGLIVTGEDLPLYYTVFSFIFFICVVPLIKK